MNDRRKMFVGVILVALALASQAKADQPFTSFPFQASGAPTARTMPARLREIKNVKDYGATGDGSTDDTTAIQAAIDDTLSPYSTANRGEIFFPAGTYILNAALTFELSAGITAIGFRGAPGAKLKGTVNDALLKRSADSPTSGVYYIENFEIENNHATGKGILFHSIVGGSIRNCAISAQSGIETYNSQSVSIQDTSLLPNGFSGGIGIQAGNATSIISTDITGFAEGIRHSNVGLIVHGGRLEVNTIGIRLGVDSTGSAFTTSGFSILGVSMESNQTSIDFSAAVNGIVAGGSIGGGVSMVRGLYMHGATAVLVAGVSVSGSFTTAAIDGNANGLITFTSVFTNATGAGPGWLIDDDHKPNGVFINSNNPSMAFPFSKLTGSPIEGMEFNITDGTDSLAWGATATNTGTHTTHYLVRYNGSNWTVVGK